MKVIAIGISRLILSSSSVHSKQLVDRDAYALQDNSQQQGQEKNRLAQILPFKRPEQLRLAREISRGREHLLADQGIVTGGNKERQLRRHGRSGNLYRPDAVSGLRHYQRFGEKGAYQKDCRRLFSHEEAVNGGGIAKLVIGEVANLIFLV